MASDQQLAARAELKRRADAELKRRAESGDQRYMDWVRADILNGLHAKQRDAFECTDRYQAWFCSRRAGKTAGIARKFVHRGTTLGPKQWMFFIAPTLQIGKDLLWAEMFDLISRYQLPWKPVQAEGYFETPTGGKFRIVGLDKLPQVGKLRGYDTVLFGTDETQEYEHLLPPLLAAVAPALTGRRGTWISAGTPGPALAGFWHDICHGKFGFTHKHWDVRDNTKNPRPGAEVIAEELARMGWDESHPTAQRELFGNWVEDTNMMVFDWSTARNSAVAPPEDYGPHWQHVIGIDVGYVDATAWVVLALDPHSRRTCIVHNEELERSTLDEDCEVTKRLIQAYRTTRIVSDPAGGGKKFYETFNARYGKELGAAIVSANKVDLLGSIALTNTELRTGRMQVVAASCQKLAHQLATLRWKNSERKDVLAGSVYADHSTDALRYALSEAAPWASAPSPGVDARSEVQRQAQEQRERRAKQLAAKSRQAWHSR